MSARLRPLFPKILLGLVVLLAALAYRDVLFWDPSSPGLPSIGWFFFQTTDTSPQIVFVIAAALVYARRKRLARALREGASPLFAVPLLFLGLAFFLWGQHVGATDLVLVSFILVCLGGGLLLFGERFARGMTLPLLLLLFAIPLPAILMHRILFPLQMWTATHTSWALNAMGVPAVQEGDMIYLAERTFEVVETCSGLRSIEVLTMLAVAWLCFFATSRLHAVLLLLSAPAIAYFVNMLRSLSLVLNPQSDVLAIHALQGVGLFLVGFALLFVVDALLGRFLDKRGPRAPEPEPAAGARGGVLRLSRGRTIALALLLAAMLGATIWMPRWEPPKFRLHAIALPADLDGWKMGEAIRVDRLFLFSVQFSKQVYRRYEQEGEAIDVFVGYGDRLRRDRSLFSPKTAFPGRGWHVEEQGVEEVGRPPWQVDRKVARSLGTRILIYHWYEGSEGFARETLRALLATDQSPLRRSGGAWVVRISTVVEPTPLGREQADARLEQFAELLRPALAELAAGSRDSLLPSAPARKQPEEELAVRGQVDEGEGEGTDRQEAQHEGHGDRVEAEPLILPATVPTPPDPVQP
jgi:EpsI family protein